LRFQFPLLGFSFWIFFTWRWNEKPKSILSIPFIGIFFLNLMVTCFRNQGYTNSFNSLYWDFLSESVKIANHENLKIEDFQFPLLGFSFWIKVNAAVMDVIEEDLSIPFIGIFFLNRDLIRNLKVGDKLSFNSLYWDFLSESHSQTLQQLQPFHQSFNSLYWDFLSESTKRHVTCFIHT